MGETPDRMLARREFLILGAAGAAAAALAACTPAAAPSAASVAPASQGATPPSAAPSVAGNRQPITLKQGHGFTAESTNHRVWTDMAQAINVRTDGEVTLEIYPNSTLGTDVELREQMVLGAPLIIGYAFGSAAEHVPELALFEAPFNFSSHEEALKVAESDMMDELAQELYEKAGFQVIARNFDNGPRHIINRVRDVAVPADLVGMKLRVPQSPIYVDTFTALGATPVPLALPEIYTGLQQGLIDGAEGFVSSVVDLKFDEVAKHLTTSGHIWQNAGMVGGKFYNALPEDLRVIIEEEARNAGEVYSAANAQAATRGLAKMTGESGVTVTEVDLAVWRAAAESVYDKLRPTLREGAIERFRDLRDG